MLTTNARAHQGIPEAYGILFEPGNPDHVVLRSRYWGYFDSRDGGKTWDYFCAEAYGGHSAIPAQSRMVVTQGGRILIAAESSGVFVSKDGCGMDAVGGFEGYVKDVALANVEGTDVVAVESAAPDGGIQTYLDVSRNAGDTWSRLGAPLPAQFSGYTVKVDPAHPERILVAGRVLGAEHLSLGLSADSGAHFTLRELPADFDAGLPVVAAIHPTRPDVFVIRIDASEALGSKPVPDRVLVTFDGGESFLEPYAARGDLPGVALSEDGSRLFVTGPADGLHVADIAAVEHGAQGAFVPRGPEKAFGVTIDHGRVFLGVSIVFPPYSLVTVSSDDGLTFEPFTGYCNMAFRACPADSAHERACRYWWGDEIDGYVTHWLSAPPCVAPSDAGASPDAGARASVAPASAARGGCSVARASGARSRGAGALVAALACSAVIRRRRRRARTGRQAPSP